MADAARAAEDVQKNRIRCSELQKVIGYMEKERSRLLEIMERKQQLRIGAPKEGQETIFQALGDGISEMERELREAGKELRQVTLEWKGAEVKGRIVMDASRSDVTWMAASGTQSSKAEIGPSGESGYGVNRKGSLEDQSPMSSAGMFAEEGSGTERICGYAGIYESCQQNDMEVDEHKSLEELGFVPRAVSDSAWWRELLRVKYMCPKKCKDDVL